MLLQSNETTVQSTASKQTLIPVQLVLAALTSEAKVAET